MRIDAYTQVQQIYGAKKPNKTQSVTKSASFSDQLQISSIGKDIQVAKAAVASAPDVRSNLTSSIKASIDAGTYSVDAGSFADKLLAKYEELR